MYKQRFRRWGFRKNIRLQEAEDEMDFYELTNARELRRDATDPSSAVQLANGQVVDLDRLVAHLRRKMLYRRQTQKTIAPTYVTPPEELYVCEAVLNDTRAYLVSYLKRGPKSEGYRLTCSGPPQNREATIKKRSPSPKTLTNSASPSPPRLNGIISFIAVAVLSSTPRALAKPWCLCGKRPKSCVVSSKASQRVCLVCCSSSSFTSRCA